MSMHKTLDGVGELEHRVFIASVKAQRHLRELIGSQGLTYGEMCSFEIARYRGVTAEAFAALPSRERMKWLDERRERLMGRGIFS